MSNWVSDEEKKHRRWGEPVVHGFHICTQFVLFSLIIVQFTIRHPLLSGQEKRIQSVYTSLSGNGCRHFEGDPETGATKDNCTGVGGFQLLVLNDDNRSSITVVTPEGKEFPLEYWSVVTHSFSNLGPRAEWRVVGRGSKTIPIALIVRVEYMDQRNIVKPQKESVLSVAKITPETICVVQNVKSEAGANAHARIVADNAGTGACLEALP
jgi:hypothetical protein